MNSILVPVEFGHGAEVVADVAADLCVRLEARLWLLHVGEPEPDFIGYEVGPKAVRDQEAKMFRGEHRELQRLAEAIRGRGVEVTALLVQGSTVDSIIGQAHKLNVEMIVIGGTRKGAIRHILLGNTGKEVMKKSPCPVLVVPCESPDR